MTKYTDGEWTLRNSSNELTFLKDGIKGQNRVIQLMRRLQNKEITSARCDCSFDTNLKGVIKSQNKYFICTQILNEWGFETDGQTFFYPSTSQQRSIRDGDRA